MNKNVIWKAIPGYEGYYEVSTEGEIRSLDRYVNNRNSFVVGRIMHLSMGPSGYLQVGLCKNGKRKNFKVHKIVAKVFIPNPDNKPCVDHINTCRTDNRACNLRWVSLKENSSNPLTIIHSKFGKEKVMGIRKSGCHKFNKDATNKPKPVHRYNLDGVYIDSFQSLLDAETVTGIEINGIKNALNKIYKHAGGYLWKTEKALFCEPYKRRRHTKCKVTEMLNECGCVVRSWPSIRDAAKELGTTHTRIIRYMNERISMNGYYFKYK